MPLAKPDQMETSGREFPVNFRFKRVVATTAALIVATLGLSAMAVPAMATTKTDDLCVVKIVHHDEESHKEFKYSKVIPGKDATSHKEYRYQTRTKVYGEIEHKFIKSKYDFVDGGTTKVNGKTVSGHWVDTGATTWHPIPDSVINAVWGSGGVPAQYIGGSEDKPKGNVGLTTYGGPNVTVPYYAALTKTDAGFTAWGPWSGWSTTNPGANTDLMNVESKSVSDNNGTPDKTVFYLPGGGQSDTNTNANWTTDTPSAPWVKIEEKKVVDKAAWDEKVYGPCPTDAVATVSLDQAETCLNPSTVKFTLTNATWDSETYDKTVGTHTRTATADPKHLFPNGTSKLTVSYTIKAADPSLCPLTAVATASTDQVESCLAPSTVKFDLQNAKWITDEDRTVGTHTRTAKADAGHLFPNGTSTLVVEYTIKDADPTLCPKTADAAATPDQAETCLENSTVKFHLTHATWDSETYDRTVGTHTRTATSDKGHLFSNGTSTLTVTYTIKAADPALCPKDATATGDTDQVETCLTPSTVKFSLKFAKWDTEEYDQTVGTHTRTATAELGHLFPNGTSTLVVEYTVKDADPSLCPQDATASVSIDKAATCTTSETVKLTVVNATLDEGQKLDQSVGTHSVSLTANKGSLFANGTAKAIVKYVVHDKKDPKLCTTGGIDAGLVGAEPSGPLSTEQIIWMIALLAVAAGGGGVLGYKAHKRRKARMATSVE